MEGNVASMADLHTTYLNVCKSNSIGPNETRLRSRKEVKKFLIEEISGIVSSAAKQRNISERVYLELTRDAAIWRLEEDSNEHQLKIFLQAALVIVKYATHVINGILKDI